MKKMLLDNFHFLGRKVNGFMTKKEIKSHPKFTLRHPEFTLRHPELVSGSIFKKFRFQMPRKQDMLNKFSTIAGFTLAETLITLMVIGVIAVLVIPQFINNINEKDLEKEREVTAAKLLEGLYQMKADDALRVFNDTDDFLNEFQKYVKVSSVTKTPSTILNYDIKNSGTVVLNSQDNIDLSKLTNIDSSKEEDTDMRGIILADGTTYLIGYKLNCEWPKNTENSRDTSILKCLYFIRDVNGKKTPNTVGKDIITNNLTINPSGNDIGLYSHPDLNFKIAFGMSYEPTYDENLCTYGEYVDDYICDEGESCDYWQGAYNACNSKGMRLPNRSEIKDIWNILMDCTYQDYNGPNWDNDGGFGASCSERFIDADEEPTKYAAQQELKTQIGNLQEFWGNKKHLSFKYSNGYESPGYSYRNTISDDIGIICVK